ncbi:MAG: glycosyltransferase family 4 protein [bacterium]|jgi:glycosyltransferase involved in cell wall biosynthesis
MMKVLLIASVASHVRHFHREFIAHLQRRGCEVHLAARFSAADNFVGTGVVCHEIGSVRTPYSLRNILVLVRLVRLMARERFALVHVHTPVAALLGRIAALATGTRPVLYTVHGFHFYRGAPLRNWLLYYPPEWLLAKATDGILVMNEEDRGWARRLAGRRTAVHFVPGVGIDIDKYAAPPAGGPAGGRKYSTLLTVAELNRNKNHRQALAAVRELTAAGNTGIRYLIAGQGKALEGLQSYVRAAGLGQQVVFLGYREDIPALLAEADIFLLTSLREGLPRCLMEAMAAGKPVVATAVRGSRDLIRDGINGFLVPPHDSTATAAALRRLLADAPLRAEFGARGREMVNQYRVENVIGELDRIYSRYLGLE